MKVLNIRSSSREEKENSVYIGRNSKYWKLENIDYFNGKYKNIFEVGKDGTIKEVLFKYEKYIRSKYSVEEVKRDLNGKDLLCFCAPYYCHGNILKEICENE
jgi:hypothetical protein